MTKFEIVGKLALWKEEDDCKEEMERRGEAENNTVKAKEILIKKLLQKNRDFI